MEGPWKDVAGPMPLCVCLSSSLFAICCEASCFCHVLCCCDVLLYQGTRLNRLLIFLFLFLFLQRLESCRKNSDKNQTRQTKYNSNKK